MNSPSIWWSRRFRLGWILIFIACINALGWTLVRWNYENSMRQVQLTVDYEDTRTLADAYQVPHLQLLGELKKRGISSVGLYNLTLASYRDNGRIAITSREEATQLYPNVAWRNYLPAYRYLVTASPENQALLQQFLPRLRNQGQPSLPPKVVPLGSPNAAGNAAGSATSTRGTTAQIGILIPASRQLISDAVMGFDPAQVRAAKTAGLKVTARVSNSLNLNAQRIETLLDDAKATGANVVIFSEEEVLGYTSLFKNVAHEMRNRGLVFGNIEFSKQRGWEEFAKSTDGLVVRVHSVGGEEAAKARTELMVDRYARAVKERNIRVAYIRLLRQYKGETAPPGEAAAATTAGNTAGNTARGGAQNAQAAGDDENKTALQQNLEFVESITRELRAQPVPAWLRPGMVASAAPAFGDYPTTWVAERLGNKNNEETQRTAKLILIAGRFLSGLGAVGATLLMLNLFFDWTRRGQMMWFLLGVLIVAGLSLSAGIGAKAMALVVGIWFSVIGMMWGGLPRFWDYLSGEHPWEAHTRREPRPWKLFWRAFGVLVRTTLITSLGGLLIMSLLNSWRYMSKTDEFLGEKATLLAPLLLIAFAFTGEVFPHRVLQEGASAARWRARQRFLGVLSQPFTVRIAVMLLALLFGGFIFIARTGNDSGMEVSSFEWHMRAALEQLFLTRPRTKELFVGMPAMIFVVWFARRGRWWPAYLMAIAATIGQADVINTFSHIHTPIFYSLLRTIHGVWLGAIVGGLALWAYRAIEMRLVGRMRTASLPPRPQPDEDVPDEDAEFAPGSSIGRVFVTGRTDATPSGDRR